MKHKNEEKVKTSSVFGWWLIGVLPFVSLYWIWKVSKMLANHKEEEE